MKTYKNQIYVKAKMLFIVMAAMLLATSCKQNSEPAGPETPEAAAQKMASSNVSAAAEVWNKANLTNYESYPDPGSPECIEYNGCLWAGQFAFVSGVKPESWVKANNIISIHSKDAAKYKLKTLRIRQGNKTIDAKVYDRCSDSDCEDNCCTVNARQNGLNFLIDIEKYTMWRFGSGDGIVEWRCLDCN